MMLEEQLRTLGMHPPGEMEARVLAFWRTKTPAERLAAAFNLHRFAQQVIAGGLKTKHPDWSEERIASEAARRMLDGSRAAS